MTTATITKQSTKRARLDEMQNTFGAESLSKSNSRSRASRSTTSCTECRRRKQKCNQGQPCSNCKRRSPEPLCEYGPRNKQNKEIAGLPKDLFPTFSVEIENVSPDTKPGPSGGAARARAASVAGAEDSSADEGSAWQAVLDFRTVRSFLSPKQQKAAKPARSDRSESRTPTRPPSAAPSHDTIARQRQSAIAALGAARGKASGWPEVRSKEDIYLNLELTKMTHRFKGCFNGPPDPDNPFVREFLPWSFESPLVSLISQYVGAKVLAQAGTIEKEFVLNLKGQAIQALNHKLTTELKPSMETLAGVSLFIVIEFFFGELEVLKLHLMGFKQIVQLLGGLPQHGIGALMARAAIVNDRIVALAFESTPVLRRGPDFDFEYQDPPTGIFQINFNTPVCVSPYPFELTAGALGLQHTTAAILDDLRFLIDKVLSLGPSNTAQEIQQVRSLASWIYQGICELPMGLYDTGIIDPELLGGTESYAAPLSLIPDHMSYSSRSSRSPDPHSSPTPPGASPVPTINSSPPPTDGDRGLVNPYERPPPELMYALVRAAAPIYARAIAMRQPLSVVCSEADALTVLTAAWHIPLTQWRAAVGVFSFAFEAILPTMHRTEDPALAPHASFVKGIVQAGHMQMSIENWCVGCQVAQRTLRLWEWLREGGGPSETDMPRGSPSELMMDAFALWPGMYEEDKMDWQRPEPRPIGVYTP